ncbi:MAG: DUF4350 domain-containing protein [Thermoplasmata archaeon]
MNNKVTIYIITIAVFFLILILSISAPIVVNESEYSIYNTDWNGCSEMGIKTRNIGSFTPNIELVEGKHTEVSQKELTEYDVEPENSGLMILGPREEFSENDTDYVDSFLRNGGIMVLSDDFGSGNDLLEALETDSSFKSSPLLDLAFEKKPELGVAYNLTEHNITENVSNVMLNSPTAIEKDPNATTIMSSSEASWLDTNENRVKDEGESFEKYPLITTEDYGEGELILVSDPDIFINSMQDKKDNRILSENILRYISKGRSNIIFDESHREMSFLYRIIYTGNVPTLLIGALLLSIAVGIGIESTISMRGEDLFEKLRNVILHILGEEEEEEGAVGKVLNNHPDWDKDKLNMIYERFDEG